MRKEHQRELEEQLLDPSPNDPNDLQLSLPLCAVLSVEVCFVRVCLWYGQADAGSRSIRTRTPTSCQQVHRRPLVYGLRHQQAQSGGHDGASAGQITCVQA